MAWETVTPKNRRVYATSGGCSLCITSRVQEAKKDGSKRTARMQIDASTMDRLRLKLRDRVAWVVDKDRKAVAFVLDEKGACSISPGSGKTSSKLRVHVPREIAEFMRQEWGVGRDEHAHTFAVELVLSGGYIEIKRKGE